MITRETNLFTTDSKRRRSLILRVPFYIRQPSGLPDRNKLLHSKVNIKMGKGRRVLVFYFPKEGNIARHLTHVYIFKALHISLALGEAWSVYSLSYVSSDKMCSLRRFCLFFFLKQFTLNLWKYSYCFISLLVVS